MVRAAFCLDSSRRSGENYSGVGFLRVAGCREFVAWRTPMVFRARRVGLAASGWPDGGWDENTSRVVRVVRVDQGARHLSVTPPGMVRRLSWRLTGDRRSSRFRGGSF
jgi:hypothetical protein